MKSGLHWHEIKAARREKQSFLPGGFLFRWNRHAVPWSIGSSQAAIDLLDVVE